MKDLNKKLWHYRNQQHLKQEYVAAQMGISQSTYSKLESGQLIINDKYLTAFIKAVGITEEMFRNDEVSTQERSEIPYLLTPMETCESSPLNITDELFKQCQYLIHRLDLIEKRQIIQYECLITIINAPKV